MRNWAVLFDKNKNAYGFYLEDVFNTIKIKNKLTVLIRASNEQTVSNVVEYATEEEAQAAWADINVHLFNNSRVKNREKEQLSATVNDYSVRNKAFFKLVDKTDITGNNVFSAHHYTDSYFGTTKNDLDKTYIVIRKPRINPDMEPDAKDVGIIKKSDNGDINITFNISPKEITSLETAVSDKAFDSKCVMNFNIKSITALQQRFPEIKNVRLVLDFSGPLAASEFVDSMRRTLL